MCILNMGGGSFETIIPASGVTGTFIPMMLKVLKVNSPSLFW